MPVPIWRNGQADEAATRPDLAGELPGVAFELGQLCFENFEIFGSRALA